MSSSGFLFRGLLKSAERFGPHLIEVGSQAGHSIGVELIQTTRPILDIGYETRIFQHFEVLRYSRAADGQAVSEFIDGDRSRGEFLENRHARRVGESVQTGL